MNENGSTKLLQAQTQTWNHIYNFVSSSAAKCAVQLGIPDVVLLAPLKSYLLNFFMVKQWILHNWGDEDCVKILKKCKESIPSREKGGKVIIIGIVLENPKEKDDSVRAQHNMDLVMMVLFGAKERTKKEWEKLFTEAGFNEYEITPTLGTRSLIEIYP
uniref:Trans-resveratrol di-O-methyltransferase n=1 Tax=Nicotiana tabacum TaxID=4097 RepID=A0A1S3ZBS1_TOBAC|nr:PREDICTED: trans-resveratrol di-O-methyltransferase-like [Nicotiana tabacum]